MRIASFWSPPYNFLQLEVVLSFTLPDCPLNSPSPLSILPVQLALESNFCWFSTLLLLTQSLLSTASLGEHPPAIFMGFTCISHAQIPTTTFSIILLCLFGWRVRPGAWILMGMGVVNKIYSL